MCSQHRMLQFWKDMKSAQFVDYQTRVLSFTVPVRANHVKIKNKLNPSDLLTKHLTKAEVQQIMEHLQHHYENGTSAASPKLVSKDGAPAEGGVVIVFGYSMAWWTMRYP